MQDAAAEDQPRLILKTHHSGRSIFQGRNSKEAQSQSKIFIPMFRLTVWKYHSYSLISSV